MTKLEEKIEKDVRPPSAGRSEPTASQRPPVVAILGHIDHGKSTLIDYIKKTNVTGTEAGGITQHINTYEAVHTSKDGREKQIKECHLPYLVVITKIDKPSADILRTKQNLAENEIYVEGYGGSTPVVALSAKTGEGVDEFLEMI